MRNEENSPTSLLIFLIKNKAIYVDQINTITKIFRQKKIDEFHGKEASN